MTQEASTTRADRHEGPGRPDFQAGIVDATPVPMLVRDLDGVIIRANAAFARLLGRHPNRLHGQSLLEILPATVVDALLDMDRVVVEAAADHQQPIVLTDFDGRVRHVLATTDLYRDEQERVRGFVTTFTDVTTLHAAIASMRQREQALATILDTIPVPVSVRDANGRYLLANREHAAFYGLTSDGMVGSHLSDHLSADHLAEVVALDASTLQGMSSDGEAEIVDGAGTTRHVFMSRAPLYEYEGSDTPSGVVSAFVDVTAVKRAEAEARRARDAAEQALVELRRTQATLVQQEKLAALGGLVAGMAHEINTPVGIALTSATHLEDETRRLREMLDSKELTSGDLGEYLRTAVRALGLVVGNCRRAADLVQSFKQVAVEHQSEERKQFFLHELVREVAANIGPRIRQLGHQLGLSVPRGIRMHSFPGPLAQVLLQCLGNALDHAFAGRQGGDLRLLAARLDDERLQITIADDGSGIPPEVLARIFDPFFTTRRAHGGTGMGLPIVHTIVTGWLGGTVAVESEPGNGTRTQIVIPLTAPQFADIESTADVATTEDRSVA